MNRGVELLRAREVGAERLFHDDAAALDEPCLVQLGEDGEGALRRDAEVVQALAALREMRLGLLDGLAQGVRARVGADEGEAVVEVVPLLVGDRVGGELGDGGARELAERLRVEILERRPDNAQVVTQVAGEQVEQPGKELASSEVAGGAEQDDGGCWCWHGPSIAAGRAKGKARSSVRARRVKAVAHVR